MLATSLPALPETLRFEQEGAVARLVFNRPNSRNALTLEMYEGLAAVCAALPEDGPIRVLILKGAGGRAFAAGTDMTEFRAFSGREDALAYEARMDGVLSAVENCAVPTIAALAGACTGGGAAISACCDIRLSDARLKWGFPIARTLGNTLSVAVLARVERLLGAARLSEIALSARLIEAEEALAAGLVSEILADAEALDARAEALAVTLASHAPITLACLREGLRRLHRDGPGAEDADLIVRAYLSEDFTEGREAFLAKRKPQWRGR
ncbi:MAG: enoyl-CoA hydratase [Pseudomonadota bacterium]